MTITEATNLLADAIAFAEGYYVTGSRPNRDNNPGDLTEDLTGKGIGKDGPFVIYATDSDGWDALRRQVELMLTNASHIYNNNMTIYEVAQRYTTTEQLTWATNVANRLGVPLDTKLSSFITAVATTAGVGLGVLIVFGILWILSKKGKI